MKNKELSTVIINEDYLKDKIYFIRGQKVMLDSDLAKIYGYSTKRFNEQVQRNIDKFPEDFIFQLTFDEMSLFLRSQNATLNKNNNKQGMHYKYRHYVFTEQGVYMLMTILRSPLATIQSIALIRTFKAMKDYFADNKELIESNRIKQIETRTNQLEEDVKDIKGDLGKVMDVFDDADIKSHYLILDGERLKADIAYQSIFKKAKKSIIYIDDYINLKTLSMLSLAKSNINITIISDNKAKDKVTEFMINDFKTQNKTNKLTLIKNNNKCHDRFIVLDFNTKNEKIYHCGASIKDAGNKISTIIEIKDTKQYANIIK